MLLESIRRNKVSFVFTVIGLGLAIAIFFIDGGVWGNGKLWLWINLVSAVFNAYLVFGPRNSGRIEESGRYSEMLRELSLMSKTIAKLEKFLNSEKGRISQVQEFVDNLEKKKEQLEPIVSSHQETVEAILSAYSSKDSRWKGAVFGFSIGVLSSVTGAYVLKFFE